MGAVYGKAKSMDRHGVNCSDEARAYHEFDRATVLELILRPNRTISLMGMPTCLLVSIVDLLTSFLEFAIGIVGDAEVTRLSEARAESILDLGRVWLSLILTSTAGAYTVRHVSGLGVRSLEGLPLEDHRRQRTTPDPDKAFNVILGRCAHWANCPNKMAVCQSLVPDRLES
ncbi:hypothetical protein PanWU01x14_192160 [Parasponia andersonii]|uniref:Uncharacterized protein n=1 Tax=Parasponia andersonii TaxID=3476 RepID=A0A2P5C1B9_PARAD|nr:hypothetical protein PanWU01x14_192160 [Parasponia andersonii]